jgi:RNA polymerase sigma-70 factor (ECF subfamily)
MDVMDRATELRLVEGLRNGEVEAFDAVFQAYRARVFAFLLRLSRHRTLAEDLLDEVWLRLVAHAHTLRPDTRLAPWLFTVARNLYWSHRRSVILEEGDNPGLLGLALCPASWPSPFDLAAAGELERRVERALAALPPQQREVLLLVGREGLTPGEAAEVCGTTPEAMRQRLARARAALADAIDRPRLSRVPRRSFAT